MSFFNFGLFSSNRTQKQQTTNSIEKNQPQSRSYKPALSASAKRALIDSIIYSMPFNDYDRAYVSSITRGLIDRDNIADITSKIDPPDGSQYSGPKYSLGIEYTDGSHDTMYLIGG